MEKEAAARAKEAATRVKEEDLQEKQKRLEEPQVTGPLAPIRAQALHPPAAASTSVAPHKPSPSVRCVGHALVVLTVTLLAQVQHNGRCYE